MSHYDCYNAVADKEIVPVLTYNYGLDSNGCWRFQRTPGPDGGTVDLQFEVNNHNLVVTVNGQTASVPINIIKNEIWAMIGLTDIFGVNL